MIKLSLRELEQAVANPAAFHKKMAAKNPAGEYIPPSYYNQLRNAVYKFHSHNNPIEGGEYLTTRLVPPKFTSANRKKDIFDQYDWYVNDFVSSKAAKFDIRFPVAIRHMNGITIDLEFTGEIGRLDIRQAGGYEVWLFRKNEPANWTSELRMPLIQDELSKRLNTIPNEIFVGIYSFEEKFKGQVCYSNQQIADAKTKFDAFAVDYLQLV